MHDEFLSRYLLQKQTTTTTIHQPGFQCRHCTSADLKSVLVFFFFFCLCRFFFPFIFFFFFFKNRLRETAVALAQRVQCSKSFNSVITCVLSAVNTRHGFLRLFHSSEQVLWRISPPHTIVQRTPLPTSIYNKRNNINQPRLCVDVQ